MIRSIDLLIRRDRLLLIGGVAALTLITWWYMVVEARSMSVTGVCECFGLRMSGPDTKAWGWVELIALCLMWSEMMVAMMAPTAAPMLLTFAAVNRRRRERERPFVPTAVFLAGYLAVWCLFSVGAALGQWTLHGLSLLSPMMTSTSPMLGGMILIGAGLFQWTPLKTACLWHCGNPLTFIMSEWREGKGGALRMGIKHGVYCSGCCWLLMLVLFVTGVMNLTWIALLSFGVLIEKLFPQQLWLSRAMGAGLVAWGGWMLRGA